MIKKLLLQATESHKLLAQTFWKVHLRMDGKFFFSCDHDVSGYEDD